LKATKTKGCQLFAGSPQSGGQGGGTVAAWQLLGSLRLLRFYRQQLFNAHTNLCAFCAKH
jgi:hypothetical protein